jgi:hypothetical protein
VINFLIYVGDYVLLITMKCRESGWARHVDRIKNFGGDTSHILLKVQLQDRKRNGRIILLGRWVVRMECG